MNFIPNDLSFFDTMQVFTYHKLDFDMLPCSLETVREYYPHKPHYDQFSHYKIPNHELLPEFVNILERGGLEVKHAEVFYRPGTGPAMDSFIHTDGHYIVPGLAKINFVVGESQNKMSWWKPRTVTEKNHMKTPIGTNYLKFDVQECTLIDSVDMRGLYVVNAGIPHSVQMMAGSALQPRICISVTPLLSSTKKNVGCREAVVRLNHGYHDRTISVVS